ncbi:hypothetical protein ACIBSW_13190 [Actinoplanes sp. NPDC049668]|uniref:hypothetical protein n=1 Tax=unclassified Actinoplanes TaxID=2626549 RepID=UPI00339F9F6C
MASQQQDVVFQFFDPATSTWTDQRVLTDPPIKTYRYGIPGELQAAKIEVTLDNEDDRYDPDNPMSPLYGIVGRYTRCRVRQNDLTATQAEAASFSPERSLAHVAGRPTPGTEPAGKGKAVCRVVAEGLLRRVLSWTTTLQSPMYRAPQRLVPRLIGHWPMEDGRDASALTNAAPNGRPGTQLNVTFQGNDGSGGSSEVISLAADSVMTGVFASASATAGWQLSLALQLAALPADGTLRPIIQWWCSNGYRWTFSVNNTSYQWDVVDSSGASVNSHNSAFGAGAAPNQWLIHRIKVSESGGTVTTEPAWYTEGTGTVFGVTDTFAGTVGALTRWRIAGNAHLVDAGIGHLFAVTTTADNLQSNEITRSFDGYPGETAANRFGRLMDEEGLLWYLDGDFDDTELMGFQRAGTLQSHLEEIMRTDDALIVDERLDATGLTMITRKFRSGQTPALELQWPGDITPPLRKITGDKDLYNHVTAANAAGGEYTAVLESGPLSTAEQPNGIGEKKQRVDVNVELDEQLKSIAEWYRSKGTVGRARYTDILVNVRNRPDLEEACQGVDVGMLITVAGLEFDTIPLLVIAIERTIETHRTIFAFTCEPADTFDVGRYDSGDKWSSATTVLGGTTYAPSATSLTLSTTSPRDRWSTTATPYDLKIAGEVVTCTAMGAASGSGPYTQTATVRRSVNGVRKWLSAGDEVHLANPKKWGR